MKITAEDTQSRRTHKYPKSQNPKTKTKTKLQISKKKPPNKKIQIIATHQQLRIPRAPLRLLHQTPPHKIPCRVRIRILIRVRLTVGIDICPITSARASIVQRITRPSAPPPARQLRRRPMHDRGQLREHVRVRLGRVRVVAQRDLDEREPERPHVGRDGVCPERVCGFAFYAFRLWGGWWAYLGFASAGKRIEDWEQDNWD